MVGRAKSPRRSSVTRRTARTENIKILDQQSLSRSRSRSKSKSPQRNKKGDNVTVPISAAKLAADRAIGELDFDFSKKLRKRKTRTDSELPKLTSAQDVKKAPSAQISFTKSPLKVISYFAKFCAEEVNATASWILTHRSTMMSVASVFVLTVAVYFVPGAHQQLVQHIEQKALWYSWWLFLGVLSSIGLGTGMHTFVLFLAPHIMQVTRAAYECGNTSFAIYGDAAFECINPSFVADVKFVNILQKVALESLFWGIGTAIGELPPYFVARGAALAGKEADDETLELEELKRRSFKTLSMKEKAEVVIYDIMMKYGFFGILLCASIPNPLFDLAGLTCGHFLVPFGTFFGATLLGKAVFKASFQSILTAGLASDEVVNFIFDKLDKHKPEWKEYGQQFLSATRKKYNAAVHTPGIVKKSFLQSFISFAWNGIIAIIVLGFVLSMIESFALLQYKREQRRNKQGTTRTDSKGRIIKRTISRKQ